MLKQYFYLVFITVIGCTAAPKATDNDNSESQTEEVEMKESMEDDIHKVEEIDDELKSLIVQEDKEDDDDEEAHDQLRLVGIYEFDQKNDTEEQSENQYIAFQTHNYQIEGWYYGMTDEFDKKRDGYLPGYFVSKIKDFQSNGDSISFRLSVHTNECYALRFPVGIVDSVKLNDSFESWAIQFSGYKELQYKGVIKGNKIELDINGKPRTYFKTRNKFYKDTNNYDPIKCNKEILFTVEENMTRLDEETIFNFFESFGYVCEENIEYSEWSNQLLFNVMAIKPKVSLNVLERNASILDTTYIFNELSHPVAGSVSSDSLTNAIERAGTNNKMKVTVLRHLQK